MRILIAGFQHETNTFAPSKTSYDDFVRWRIFQGKDVFELRDVNCPVGGFIRRMEKDAELVPVLWACATPAAHVEKDAFEKIAGKIVDGARGGNFDGVYLDLHGAMVCEHVDDGEGVLLSRVRSAVGPNVPIVASLDLHANVTPLMLENADALVAYRTYPHEDMAETGDRAAFLLNRLINSGNSFYRASKRIPFLIPINAMCTLVEPAATIYRNLAAAELRSDVSLSFCPGFPAADFPGCGPVVWGYGDSESVEVEVERLAEEIISKEAEWNVPFLAPEEAVRMAQALALNSDRPVIIADAQDNPGGGADSNTTGILRALIACKAEGAAIGLITDSAAARAAHEAGVGADITIALGGQSGVIGDAPFHGTFRVQQISDGIFRFDGPMMNGRICDVGPSARLSIGGVQIVISTFKEQLIDRNFYRMAGVQPEDMKILVVKSAVHFRADFGHIAHAILVAKAPGPALADPADYPWKQLARGMRLRPLGPAFLP